MSMPSSIRIDRGRILRFGSVGLANTTLGYAVILAGLSFGLGDFISNVAGFAAGLSLGFYLNRKWTFRNQDRADISTIGRYLIAFAAAFSVNLAIIASARAMGFVENPLSHLAGIGVYSIVFYLACSRYVFTAAPSPSNPTDIGSSQFWGLYWPEISIVIAWLGALLAIPMISVSHDVVWQMWIARQMIGGTELYSGIMEVNPPLWFWMAIPVEWLAQAFSVPSSRMVVAATLLLAGLSLAVTASLVAEANQRIRAGVLWPAFLALVLLPLNDFAQREHLCLIAVIPYLVLAAHRADGKKVAWPKALAVGLLSAPGFALKHYFILAPLLLEAWILFRNGRSWTPFRPEILTLAGGAVCYALAIFAFTPNYLTSIVPMLNAAYADFGSSFASLILSSWVAIWLFGALALWHVKTSANSLLVAAAIAASGFALAFVVQQKGWSYHALPVNGAIFFAVVSAMITAEWNKSRTASLLILACSAALLACSGIMNGPYENRYATDLNKLLASANPGDTVAVLTGHPSHAWPMVDSKGLKWPSRHFAFWMTHAFAESEQNTSTLSPKLSKLAETTSQQTVDDFACNPPKIIIVDDYRISNSPGFDILEFFKKDQKFADLFSHYIKRNASGIFTAYEQGSQWSNAESRSCRTLY